MKSLQTEFKEFCVENFGEENGEKIYVFYRSLDKGRIKQGSKNLSLSERRIRSLDYLKENFDDQAILNTIDIFNKKLESGESVVLTIPYFNKAVENNFKSTSKGFQTNPIFVIQKPEKVIIPIKLRKQEVCDYPIDAFNWVYKCSECNTEFDGWSGKCPNCNSIIDWKSLKEGDVYD